MILFTFMFSVIGVHMIPGQALHRLDKPAFLQFMQLLDKHGMLLAEVPGKKLQSRVSLYEAVVEAQKRRLLMSHGCLIL